MNSALLLIQLELDLGQWKRTWIWNRILLSQNSKNVLCEQLCLVLAEFRTGIRFYGAFSVPERIEITIQLQNHQIKLVKSPSVSNNKPHTATSEPRTVARPLDSVLLWTHSSFSPKSKVLLWVFESELKVSKRFGDAKFEKYTGEVLLIVWLVETIVYVSQWTKSDRFGVNNLSSKIKWRNLTQKIVKNTVDVSKRRYSTDCWAFSTTYGFDSSLFFPEATEEKGKEKGERTTRNEPWNSGLV